MYAHYLLPVLAAMAIASPVSLNETEMVKREEVNLCQDSSFVNKLSNRSPLIADCRQIQKNIANGGDWGVSCAGQRFSEPIVSYGSCAFGAECKTDTWSGIRIGNQDIIDLINDSIKQFGYADRVGGEGFVDCQQVALPKGRTLGIKWAVYNTADAKRN